MSSLKDNLLLTLRATATWKLKKIITYWPSISNISFNSQLIMNSCREGIQARETGGGVGLCNCSLFVPNYLN